MKKYLFILIASSVIGCSNETDVEQPKQEVEVSLDYTFLESGSMTRAGNEIYTDFYNKYIKTKQLTPTCYSLSFMNKETGATATINGLWKNKDGVKLLEGKYEVTGTSFPKRKSNNEEPLDTLFLLFKQEIEITKQTKEIILSAIHDSFMIFFNKENTLKITYVFNGISSSYEPGQNDVVYKDNVYYMFVQELLGKGKTNYIEIHRNDNSKSRIDLNNIPFEKGKFYYFNDIDNSFIVPPMEEGY